MGQIANQMVLELIFKIKERIKEKKKKRTIKKKNRRSKQSPACRSDAVDKKLEI